MYVVLEAIYEARFRALQRSKTEMRRVAGRNRGEYCLSPPKHLIALALPDPTQNTTAILFYVLLARQAPSLQWGLLGTFSTLHVFSFTKKTVMFSAVFLANKLTGQWKFIIYDLSLLSKTLKVYPAGSTMFLLQYISIYEDFAIGKC